MKKKSYPFNSKKLIDICIQHGISYIGLFGSMSRGDINPQSDIDLLVRFSRRMSLLALVHLERELTDAMGCKVDLLTDAAISPYLKETITWDLKTLYET